jgi:hypothetical protein
MLAYVDRLMWGAPKQRIGPAPHMTLTTGMIDSVSEDLTGV